MLINEALAQLNEHKNDTEVNSYPEQPEYAVINKIKGQKLPLKGFFSVST